MKDRRFQPLSHIRSNAPSQLASLNGARRPGGQVTFGKNTKPPKRRFNVGDKFVYDGSVWEITYMYRMVRDPGIWYHNIEETTERVPDGPLKKLEIIIKLVGAGETTPRIVEQPFAHDSDVHTYFADIYLNGSQARKTTQQLLKLPRACCRLT